MQRLADLAFLFWSKVIEVKFLGILLNNQVTSTPYKKKDGSYGTREEYGSIFIQLPKGLGTGRFFESNGEGGYTTKEVDLSEIDIDFTTNRKFGGKKTLGTGILRLPVKGWNGDDIYVETPTYCNKAGEYKQSVWAKNAYEKFITPNIARGAVDAFLAVLGEYGQYNNLPVTIYNGSILKNGCHNCRYVHRSIVGEEIPNIGLPDMKEMEISKIHNCYCSLMDHPVLEEAYDLINESMSHDSDIVPAYDKEGNMYFTVAGKGKVKYGNRILSWDELQAEAGSAECCPHYSFNGITGGGQWYSAPLSPSTIMHTNSSGLWVVGKPEVGYAGKIGFLAGNHVLVTVAIPDYVNLICEGNICELTHEQRIIDRPVATSDLYEEYRATVLLGLQSNYEDWCSYNEAGEVVAEPTTEELLRLSLEDIIIAPRELHRKLFDEVVQVLEITDIDIIDVSLDLLEDIAFEHRC
jgi:hypothetical protein